MVSQLRNRNVILPRLYEDYISYVEEISLIEEDYLRQNVTVYADNPVSIGEFMIMHTPSFYWGGNTLSVYMAATRSPTIAEFASILEKKKDSKMHLQTSAKVGYVRRSMPWLNENYTVRYCKAMWQPSNHIVDIAKEQFV